VVDDPCILSDGEPDVYDVLAEAMPGEVPHEEVLRFLRRLSRGGYTLAQHNRDLILSARDALGDAIAENTHVEAHKLTDDMGVGTIAVDVMGVMRSLATSGYMVLARPKVRHDMVGVAEGPLLTHPEERCAGGPCCIHNPSSHRLDTAPLSWSDEERLMSRVCTHGQRHPDPDHLDWLRRVDAEMASFQSIHLCDGCCDVLFSLTEEGP